MQSEVVARSVEPPQIRAGNAKAYILTGMAGAAFALLTWGIMSLEPRFMLAATALVIVISAGMVAIFRIEDFLVYLSFLNVPFASFGKWMFVQPVITVAKGIALGLAEFILFFGYLMWFCQVFVARVRPLPKLGAVDALFAVIFTVQCLSLLGAPDRQLAFFDIVYNLKFYLIYFFIAHKIERRHLKLVIALLLFGILVESPLALYERLSGNVGIGRAKGNVAATEFANQYEVPGLEQIRAEGTTKDAHTLGEYLAMLLPLAIVFAIMQGVRLRWRVAMAALALLGIGALIVTFSRAGWFSFLIAAIILLWVATFIWRQGQALFVAVVIAFMVGLVYPKVYEYAIVRVLDAPSEIMQTRYDLNWTALNIMQDHFLLGYGPGNFMEALSDPNTDVVGTDQIPVHNAFLYIASESGIFAALAFFSIIWISLVRCWRQRNHSDLMVRGLAMAMFAGLVAYVLDGLTNPTFREAEPYTLLWLYIGMSVALPRIAAEAASAPRILPNTSTLLHS